ncbi:hypothetical protein CJP16_08605 [Aeromonas sobria]|uniref:DUF2971 domain-containing protein n=1 Tax=Aeromonas sobria TaxID=646 RepID=A0A2N3J1E7_AERSO|nr:DUF2971 domain-containing protein [Aeromonas sobria]PKQ79392.1 hypothetical protein CJP16_08605 [Aeromonas sobria]
MKQLFKYVSQHRNLFNDGFIRLSQPSALNDPFEASFCRESLDELATYFDYSTALDPVLGEVSFSKYIEYKMHHIGIISFSESKENLLMWAHYADEHKGMVAGIVYNPNINSIFYKLFRADALINSSLNVEWSPFDGAPKPVSYRKGLRYRNDMFDYDYSNISAEGADRILHEVFMQKSDEWIYEQEHRVVLRLEQADRVIIPSLNNIENISIRERLKKSSYTSREPVTGKIIIDLLDIEDDAERVAVAMTLANLSKDSSVMYFMKLSSSAINSCLLGLKSSLSSTCIPCEYVNSKGRFEFFKAKRNEDYYSLEFEKL